MIKIKINNNSSLNEAELKYSSNLQNRIYKFALDSIEQGSDIHKYFNIKLKDVLYPSNPNILFGIPFFYYGNIKNNELPNKNIKNNLDQKQKKFNDEFINKLLNQNLQIKVKISFESNPTSIALAGAATKNNISLFLIKINAVKVNKGSLKRYIRHELQHLTQIINNTCLLYGEAAKKTEDVDTIIGLELQNIPKKQIKFGLGKQKSGLIRNVSQTDKYAAMSGDIEYETYLSDLVDSYYNRILKDQPKIKKEIKQLGANGTAVKYIKMLFTDLRYKQGYENINKMLNIILKIRPKELPKDMLKLLTDRFTAL